MSERTNSWVMVAGNHPNSNTHAIHYASSALRTQNVDKTTQIANDFNQLTYELIERRRKDAAEWERKAKWQEVQLANAEARVNDQEVWLAEAKAQLVAVSALIEALKHGKSFEDGVGL